eukprot:4585254-Alexandrium_andersonii.AAC.1
MGQWALEGCQRVPKLSRHQGQDIVPAFANLAVQHLLRFTMGDFGELPANSPEFHGARPGALCALPAP